MICFATPDGRREAAGVGRIPEPTVVPAIRRPFWLYVEDLFVETDSTSKCLHNGFRFTLPAEALRGFEAFGTRDMKQW